MEQAYDIGTVSKNVVPLRLDRKGGRGGPYALREKPVIPVRVAAKTGTAEVENGTSHAWFAAFAPADAPEALVVVLLEHGGSGGSNAAPIGLSVLRDALRMLEKEKTTRKN